jgi:hexosaminidase
MVWQDVFNNGVKLAPQTVVEVWEGSDYTTLVEVLQGKTKRVCFQRCPAGYQAVMAGYWYLDHLGNQWSDFYVDEIDDGQIPAELVNLVVGGEGMLVCCDG